MTIQRVKKVFSDEYRQHCRDIAKQKQDLADKFMSGRKLTVEEKNIIYRELTGDDPVKKKRGRPSTDDRDMSIAIEYLMEKKKSVYHVDLKDKLAINYGLTSIKTDTVTAAIKRGKKIAKETAEKILSEPWGMQHPYSKITNQQRKSAEKILDLLTKDSEQV